MLKVCSGVLVLLHHINADQLLRNCSGKSRRPNHLDIRHDNFPQPYVHIRSSAQASSAQRRSPIVRRYFLSVETVRHRLQLSTIKPSCPQDISYAVSYCCIQRLHESRYPSTLPLWHHAGKFRTVQFLGLLSAS